jgi:hypothetical protein
MVRKEALDLSLEFRRLKNPTDSPHIKVVGKKKN